MLIYEKKVGGVNHLFGTLGNVPAATDTQLTYKDADGQLVADIKALKFFYQRGIALFGGKSVRQVPAEDDIKVNVYLGEELIIGEATTADDETKNDDSEVKTESIEETASEAVVTEKVSKRAKRVVEDSEEVSE